MRNIASTVHSRVAGLESHPSLTSQITRDPNMTAILAMPGWVTSDDDEMSKWCSGWKVL